MAKWLIALAAAVFAATTWAEGAAPASPTPPTGQSAPAKADESPKKAEAPKSAPKHKKKAKKSAAKLGIKANAVK
jgi:hypothetical protein